jgi:hypothetical protein
MGINSKPEKIRAKNQSAGGRGKFPGNRRGKEPAVKKSISRNITFALLGYTLFTVLLLWMFQIIFLNKYTDDAEGGHYPRGQPTGPANR